MKKKNLGPSETNTHTALGRKRKKMWNILSNVDIYQIVVII